MREKERANVTPVKGMPKLPHENCYKEVKNLYEIPQLPMSQVFR
jgi:hypothetical protein